MSYAEILSCTWMCDRDTGVDDPKLVVALEDGREIRVPLSSLSPRLRQATPVQRSNWRLIGKGLGLHWPDIDEDLSLDGMLDVRADRYALSREIAVWKARKSELVAQAPGRYVLIVGDQVVDTYATQEEAIKAGWDEFGHIPIFTRRIQAEEPVAFIG